MSGNPILSELHDLILSSPQPALGVRDSVVVLCNDSAGALLGDIAGMPLSLVLGESIDRTLTQMLAEGRHFGSAELTRADCSGRVHLMTEAGDAAVLLYLSGERGESVLPAFMLNLDVQLRSRISTLLPAFDIISAGLDRDEPAQVKRYLSEARRSVLSLLRLSNNMRDMARCIWKYEMAEKTDCDLVALCGDVIAHTAPLASYKNVEISLDCSEKELMTGADYDKLERILYNLLSNAVLHSREGGRIDVRLRRHDEQVLIQVRDYGEGISPAHLHQIYESFKTYSERLGSMGLGLPLANELARLHGGRLLVESREGEGTTVTVMLPDQPCDFEDGLEDVSVDYTGHHPHHLVELSDFPAYNPAYAPAKHTHSGTPATETGP